MAGERKREKKKSDSCESDPDSVADVLVEDPICHKLVPKQQAIRLKDKNVIVYFCSEECCDRFVSQQGEKE